LVLALSCVDDLLSLNLIHVYKEGRSFLFNWQPYYLLLHRALGPWRSCRNDW